MAPEIRVKLAQSIDSATFVDLTPVPYSTFGRSQLQTVVASLLACLYRLRPISCSLLRGKHKLDSHM